MKKHFVIRHFLFLLLIAALLLSLAACEKVELPQDAEDPSDALINLVKDFWNSEIYENAIFDAFYNSKTASDDLKKFNRVNAANAKYLILSKSSYSADVVSIDGIDAKVTLYIHGINFGEYAETYLSEFDKLQASVMIIDGVMYGLSDEEVTMELRFIPLNAVDDERVTFRDFEQTFELRYKDGGWIVRKPAYKNGKVFLELFAEHITEVLNGSYRFRPGLEELQKAERAKNMWWGYGSFGEFLKNQFVGVISLTAGVVMIIYFICKSIIFISRRKKVEADNRFEKNYEKLLLSLTADARKTDVDGLTVEIRDCADREPGKLDPRTAAAAKLTTEDFRKNRKAVDKRLLKNKVHLLGPENPDKYSPLEYLRTQFGWVTEDRAEGVAAEKLEFTSTHGKVDLWKYEAASKRARPCIVFFHGGGFFGGIIPTVANQCKLLAKLLGGTVFAVDYPLAPEHKFPIGFDCCYEAVEWVHRNAVKLKIDPGRIGVAGDSAGGNLALVCALRARDEKKALIRYMGLIYPTVTRAAETDSEYYYFDESAYDNPDNDPYISEQINAIGKSGGMLEEWYLEKGTDAMRSYISPITASMKGLPTALVMTAEYDYLRMECEELSRRLKGAGVQQRHIRYGGIVHGTFDRLDYAPQVEDMLREMAADLRRLK